MKQQATACCPRCCTCDPLGAESNRKHGHRPSPAPGAVAEVGEGRVVAGEGGVTAGEGGVAAVDFSSQAVAASAWAAAETVGWVRPR